MHADDYRQLLAAGLPPETFVRRSLELLEAQTRELALLALGEWESVGLAGFGELLPALAAMEKPSWGTWNGLLLAIDAARAQALATGSAEIRTRIQHATGLADILRPWNHPLQPNPSEKSADGPVALESLGHAMAAAIHISNRLSFGTGWQAADWRDAESALRRLVEFLATDPLADICRRVPRRAPWFLDESSRVWSFQGRAPDFSASYTAPGGASRTEPVRTSGLVPALGRLLGIPHERELRRLLAHHAPDEIRGVLLGDFLLGRPVGEGGFGTVHMGRQLSTGRKVAIKLLHDGMPAETKARFQREAAYLARFNHRHIVGVLGYGEERWSISPLVDLSQEVWFEAFAKSAPVKTFIAMEWVEGRTLESVYQQARRDPTGKPSNRVLADWFAQTAAALCAVHAAGLVHRDVKPGNLMITDTGVIKLMDFGIARLQDQAHTLVTTPGRVFGTIMYMSPEQIRASEAESRIGPSTDIYSLCGTFYELFTCTRLYEHDAQSIEAVKTLKLRGQRPQSPRKCTRDLPWEIEVILLGGLEADVADRYRSMESLERDLRHFLQDEAIEYRRPSVPRRLRLGYRRHRAVTNVVAVSVLAAILGVGFYIQSIHEEQARTSAQKVRAERLAGESRRRLAEIYEEHARQEMLYGTPARSLVYASEAYQLGDDSRALKFLIARAAEAVPAKPAQSNGHTKGVYSAMFNPKGDVVVTASIDGVSKVWQARTGQMLYTLDPHSHREVNFAVFTPDGFSIITAGDDTTARVWDAKPGGAAKILEGHGQKVYGNPQMVSATRIITASEDATAILWNAVTRTLVARIAPGGNVNAASLSPDGRLAVAAGENGLAQVVSADDGSPIAPPFNHGHAIVDARISSDGQRLITGAKDGSAKLWDIASHRVIASLDGHSQAIRRVRFSPDDSRMVTASGDGSARLWDRQGKLIEVLHHDGAVMSAEFSGDSSKIITASRDHKAVIWDARTGEKLATLQHAGFVYFAAFSSDSTLAVTAGQDGVALVWDVVSAVGDRRPAKPLARLDGIAAAESPADQRVVPLAHRGVVTSVAFSVDGSLLATGSLDRSARLWDAKSHRLLHELTHPAAVTTVVFSPDGSRLATADGDAIARLWDVSTGSLVAECRGHTLKISDLAFSRDGRHLATAGGDHTAKVWDAATGAVIASPAHGYDVNTVEFSNDGQKLLTSCGDGLTRLWGWNSTAAPLLMKPKASGYTNDARFSPDGTRIVTSGEDGVARIWSTSNGDLVRERAGHDMGVVQARWDASSRKIVTAGKDGAAKVWDAVTGNQIASLNGHEGTVRTVRFSPDGMLVLTAGEDRTARIWDATTGRLLYSITDNNLPMNAAIWSPDGMQVLTGASTVANLRNAGLTTASPAEVAALVTQRVPWRLSNGTLVTR